jgi:aspartate aminotransferase-like enzyme
VTLKRINLTTGPVALPTAVKTALAEQPISHRSPAFEKIFRDTTELLNTHFRVNDTYLLTGSGTLANEAMICQIKMREKKGLILSNGEFGNRLMKQAEIHKVSFDRHIKSWGDEFDYDELKKIVSALQPDWILFTHCETSTGIINNLNKIVSIGNEANCACYVDCISSTGSFHIDLSDVAMASASSGKGLCSLAGIAIIFSNTPVFSDGTIPTYLDLRYYSLKQKVPFTISSNLVKALSIGCKLKLHQNYYELLRIYSYKLHTIFKEYDVMPYNNYHVFTLVPQKHNASFLAQQFEKEGIYTSYQSEYLVKRNWLQLALFSQYSEEDLQYVQKKTEEIFERAFTIHTT